MLRLAHAGGRKRPPVFFGWYVAAACFMVSFIVFGIGVNTFSVYVKPLQADLGWTRKAIAAAASLGALAMGCAAPLIGRLIDRWGARRLMIAGTLVVGGMSMLLRWTSSLPSFYAMFVLLGVGQAAATLIPISVVVANWFAVRRGLAMGIVMSGTGMGSTVMVPVTAWVVSQFGWRSSFFWMGVVIVAVAVPIIAAFIYTKPGDLGLHPDGDDGTAAPAGGDPEGLTVREAMRTRTFWLIAALMFIFGHVGLGIGVHLMAYLGDLGYVERSASLIVSLISFMTVAGKLGIGSVADRWGVRSALVCTCVLLASGIALLMAARTVPMALAFAVIYGASVGAPLVLNPTLASQCLGVAHFGGIFGLLSLASTLGAALGPIVSGATYDALESYLPAFLAFIVLLGIAALCALGTRVEEAAHPRTAPSRRAG
jgi:MFS family permease